MIKVLSIMYHENAVAYFRMGWPAKYINSEFGDQVEVTISDHTIDPWNIANLRQYDVIHFHKYFGRYEASEELWATLKSQGVTIVMDIDDYWEWPSLTEDDEKLKNSEIYMKELGNLKHADYVTTTTEYFANKIKEHNPNVVVFPNSLNGDLDIWKSEATPSDVVRVGWLGSGYRNHDLKMLSDAIKMLNVDTELSGKFKFIIAGGDEIDSSIFEGGDYEIVKHLSILEYPILYDQVDICIAPLAHIELNKCKSELKMVEAGLKKKAFVGQDYGPYVNHITQEVNGLLADTSEDWYAHLKRLILNKGLREEFGTNLYEYVKDKYDIRKTVKERVEFYKNVKIK